MESGKIDYIKIAKHIAFIVLVPSIVVGGYYGYKFIKNKIDKKKLEKEAEDKKYEKRIPLGGEEKPNINYQSKEKLENKKEAKVIDINRDVKYKREELKNKGELKLVKEA